MEIDNSSSKKVMLLLLKDFSNTHTITSIANELELSRVGAWKILKRLESEQYIKLEPVGSGKTSTYTVKMNWDNLLVKKSLALYLTKEALEQRRWRANFAELEECVDFVIMYGSIIQSPKQAKDIDIVGVAEKKGFVKIQSSLDKVQKTLDKKIHVINFTESEFKKELQKPNKAFIDTVRRGVILFGQENFVEFMKKV